MADVGKKLGFHPRRLFRLTMRRRQVGKQFVLFVFEAKGVVQGLVEVIGAARGDDHEEQRHRGKGDVQRILAEAADGDGEHNRPGI